MDLFLKESKKDLLLKWVLSRNWTFTHEVLDWAVKNKHDRALRDLQDIASKIDAPIRRMTPDEKRRCLSYETKEGVFVSQNFK